MRTLIFFLSTAVVLMTLIGCSDTAPGVSILKSLEYKFEFEKSYIQIYRLTPIDLTATCSRFVDKVEMSLDGTHWMPTTDYNPSGKSYCEDGKFSLTLSDTQPPLQGLKLGDSAIVYFQARHRSGEWIRRYISVKHSGALGPKQETLVTSHISTGGPFVLKGRIKPIFQHAAQSSDRSIRLKGRIAQ